MALRIYYDNVKYRLKGSRKSLKFIEKVIRSENWIPGDLNFIFTDDISLKVINKEFLNHNYFTDVISFNYSTGYKLNGEIYISCETVKRNANIYKEIYKIEIVRVMIHGVLHLVGYNDRSAGEKVEMRRMEDYWLKDFKDL